MLRCIAPLVLTLLTGCVATQPIVNTTTVITVPDDILLKDCPTHAPPHREDFLKYTQSERIEALGEYIIELYHDINSCNAGYEALRQWKQDTIRGVNELNR